MSAFSLHKAIQDRQYKSGCLAGAGLCQTHYVTTLQYRRYRLLLDRCRRGIARSLYPGYDLGVQIKYAKFHKLLFSAFGGLKKAPDVFRGLQFQSFYPGTADVLIVNNNSFKETLSSR
jgi:hypothetical protein